MSDSRLGRQCRRDGYRYSLCLGALQGPTEAVTLQGPHLAVRGQWGRCQQAGATQTLLTADAVADVVAPASPIPSLGAGMEWSTELLGPWHLCSLHRGDLQGLAVLRASSSIWLRCCYPAPHTSPHPFLPPTAAPSSHPAGDTAQDDAKEQLGRKEFLHWAQAPGASPKHQPELAQLWDCGAPLDPSLSHSRGVQGRRQCPGLLAALPMEAWPAGQSRVPTSPAAVVALPALAAGVLGRVAPAHTSLVLPAAAGTGAASPTSPWPPHTPRGDSAWGQYSRPPKKGKPDLALGTGTRDVPASLAPADTGSNSFWHTGIYWRSMCLMSRGISKD